MRCCYVPGIVQKLRDFDLNKWPAVNLRHLIKKKKKKKAPNAFEVSPRLRNITLDFLQRQLCRSGIGALVQLKLMR